MAFESAAMENVMYGLTYGSGVLVQRAFMAIPAHMGFAIIFGLLYGQARCMSLRRRGLESAACIAGGYLLSVFLHGAYDSAAMVSSVVMRCFSTSSLCLLSRLRIRLWT